ncbi:hypothetical protein [Methylobacterium pseudosasicola]|uniref:Uncharacterized protein n=1 Tax=Methylobacterium pseudosasicola TaxID=582667 RepID=A0A1I4HJ56_9HYPH|nr:hypothetical protein [Methylobacterium pseudosasicola]SFL42225.1 hypothetical protein SAMN05192568_1004274 [Methylobacterium pseudosasicola]
MATHAHSTRTPLLPPSGNPRTLLCQGFGQLPGPVTEAIRACRAADPADQAIAAIQDGLESFFSDASHQMQAPTASSTAALKARAADLRGALVKCPRTGGTDPHVPFGPALIGAHAAAMSVRWVFEVEDPEAEPYKAALAVDNVLRRLLAEVLALPVPCTMAGLAVVGLAAAFEVEGALSHRCLENEDKLATTARAILSLTRTKLPASFLGFGDDPDFEAREQAILTPPVG